MISCVPVLVDYSSLLKRAIFASALDDLKAGGSFTGGIYGSLLMFAAFLRRPEVNAAGVWMFGDAGYPARRKQLIPSYKEKRANDRQLLSEEDKEKAMSQMVTAKNLFKILGVNYSAFKDREADDCLMAAVKVCHSKGVLPIVVSGDGDLLQAVNYGARVWNFKQWVDQTNFREVIGVETRNYIAYRTLTGDASDSIAGAAGCGPVRAAAILNDFESLFEGATPPDQIRELKSFIESLEQKKRPAWQQSIVDDNERLVKVATGIDLSNSFGPTAVIAKKLAEPPAVVDSKGFLQECDRLQFASIIKDSHRILAPFRGASMAGRILAGAVKAPLGY